MISWWDALRAESQGPRLDLGTLMGVEPDVSVSEAWLLAASARHVDRQHFAAAIVARLGVDSGELARLGSGVHPPLYAGAVPDEPDWDFRFHGRGIALENRTTREYLDVDFLDATPRWIDASFFEAWLRSVTRDYCDERFFLMHPSYGDALVTVDGLVAKNLAVRVHNCFRIDGLAEQARERLAALARRATDPANRLRIALLFGDDGLALSEAERTGETSLVPALRARFERLGR